jgi:hypothetical protein
MLDHALRSVLATVLALVAATTLADDHTSPRLGTLVRVTTDATANPIVGTLTAIDDRTLSIAATDGAPPVVVRRPDIHRLERRTPSQRGMGAVLGMGIGFGVGVGLVAMGGGGSVDPWGYIYGAFGAGLMGGIGALVSGPRWAPVSIDRIRPKAAAEARTRVEVIPVMDRHRRGVAVSVSLR